jgi:hypothetical protein
VVEQPVQLSLFRRSLLALVMLAILLATMGGAWLLEDQAGRRVRAAEGMVAHVRAKGLASFWTADLAIRWYLIKIDAKVIGWRAEAHGQIPAGDFAGLNLRYRADPVRRVEDITVEQWKVNPEATAGEYTAGRVSPELTLVKDTQINLDAGVVEIHHMADTGPQEAKAAAPANYLPEGTMNLALALVGKAKADAQFAMVYNERDNPGGVIQFGAARLTYQGQRHADQGKTLTEVKMTYAGAGRGGEEIALLNEAGEVVGMEAGRVSETLCEEGDIAKQFPEAAALVKGLLPEGLVWEKHPPRKKATSGRPGDFVLRDLRPGE